MKDYHISVGEALDIERNKIKDHNGVSFRTYREMCDFHGIPYRRFQTRFYHGYSMKGMSIRRFSAEKKAKVNNKKTKGGNIPPFLFLCTVLYRIVRKKSKTDIKLGYMFN
jgi:hypothetical protein